MSIHTLRVLRFLNCSAHICMQPQRIPPRGIFTLSCHQHHMQELRSIKVLHSASVFSSASFSPPSYLTFPYFITFVFVLTLLRCFVLSCFTPRPRTQVELMRQTMWKTVVPGKNWEAFWFNGTEIRILLIILLHNSTSVQFCKCWSWKVACYFPFLEADGVSVIYHNNTSYWSHS